MTPITSKFIVRDADPDGAPPATWGDPRDSAPVAGADVTVFGSSIENCLNFVMFSCDAAKTAEW